MKFINQIKIADVKSQLGAIDTLNNHLRPTENVEAILLADAYFSSKIEGVNVNYQRFLALTRISVTQFYDDELSEAFKNADEFEIWGNYQALKDVFENYKNLAFNYRFILDLHKLLINDAFSYGGKIKTINNVIVKKANGKTETIFTPPAPFLAETYLQELVDDYNNDNQTHPLIKIANFLVNFGCIHPFTDGNGRVSRTLMHFLLLKAGYQFSFVKPLAKIIYETRDEYYDTLIHANKNWYTQENDTLPFLRYFLSVLFEAS